VRRRSQAERLAELGVDAVTLANNHALGYGADALLDTLA
jgi:poly-gamma-glutamate capsule biosynthesis protein CapA/YwtB (metallophosphatase superfamily)